MRTRKSVISILLAVMMIFTFMPAMAFADVVDQGGTPKTGTITSISWGSDYHTASIKVKDSQGTISTYNFDYFDTAKDAMPAEKADAKNYRERLVVMPGAYVGTKFVPGAFNSDGTVVNVLGYVDTVVDGAGANDYDWDKTSFKPMTDYFDLETEYAAPAKKANMSKTIYDAYFLAEQIKWENQWKSIDAGMYGAWYAQKDLPDNKRTEKLFDRFGNAWEHNGHVIPSLVEHYTKLNEKYFEITYPAYDAYEYDTVNGKNVDKELSIGIALKADEIKANIDNDALVSTATGTVKLVPKVKVANHAYYTGALTVAHYADGEPYLTGNNRGWYVTDNKSFNIDYAETYDRDITYDGASHKVAFVNEPKGVTVKYYITKGDKNGKYIEPKDSDWTTTCPETIKDAGTYFVAVKFVTNKDNTQYVYKEGDKEYITVTVEKMPVAVEFKQDVLRVEYGKYDAAAIEQAIKNMLVAKKAPDSTDKLEQAVQKYVTIKGLFEDAGANTVYGEVDQKGIDDDKDLAEALKNYQLVTKKGMRLVIEKADNDTVLKSVTKTYKAKKKTKKLAKKKTFKLSATSDFGTLKFKKVKGNSKIKVSANGTVTVNKGLKKGTHKVTVQAYTKGTANYAAGSDTTEIYVTIK